MNFGIKTPPQHCTWQEMVDVWRTADQLEVFSSCWNFDHFYPLVGEPTGPCMEAWVTLTALGEAGVHTVLFTMRAPLRAAAVQGLAQALEPLARPS